MEVVIPRRKFNFGISDGDEEYLDFAESIPKLHNDKKWMTK